MSLPDPQLPLLLAAAYIAIGLFVTALAFSIPTLAQPASLSSVTFSGQLAFERITPAYDRIEQCKVLYVPSDRTDLVERARKSDQAVVAR
mgnify:CR=1 FL=1